VQAYESIEKFLLSATVETGTVYPLKLITCRSKVQDRSMLTFTGLGSGSSFRFGVISSRGQNVSCWRHAIYFACVGPSKEWH